MAVRVEVSYVFPPCVMCLCMFVFRVSLQGGTNLSKKGWGGGGGGGGAWLVNKSRVY